MKKIVNVGCAVFFEIDPENQKKKKNADSNENEQEKHS